MKYLLLPCSYKRFQDFHKSDEGSSLLEAMVAIGLSIMALTASAFILIATQHIQASINERGQLASLVNVVSTDISASNTYTGDFHAQLAQGALPSAVTLQNAALGSVTCSYTRLADENGLLLLACRSQDGTQVQRIVSIAMTAPQPGSLVTPAPQ